MKENNMVLLLEKKNAVSRKAGQTSMKEASEWTPSSQAVFLQAIKKFASRKVDIFLVGPDDYRIEDGKFIGKTGSSVYCWIDRNGFVCGLDFSKISNQVQTLDGVVWSFFQGRQEVQLTFN